MVRAFVRLARGANIDPVDGAKAVAQILGVELDAYRIRVGSDTKVMDALSRFSPPCAAATTAEPMSDPLRA